MDVKETVYDVFWQKCDERDFIKRDNLKITKIELLKAVILNKWAEAVSILDALWSKQLFKERGYESNADELARKSLNDFDEDDIDCDEYSRRRIGFI